MDEWLRRLETADAAEVDMVFDLALRRKRELYPRWDIDYAAVPREDGQQRRRTVEGILRFLKMEQEGG